VLRLSTQTDLRPIGLQSVLTYGEMVQYQLAPGQGVSVTVRYMAGRPLSKAQEAALSRALNAGIGHDFAYQFEQVERIVQTPGRKHRRWLF
jgi:hypothetical protein